MRVAKVIDVTPDVSEITGIAGSSFSLILTLEADAGYSSASHSISVEFFPYKGAAPAIDQLDGTWSDTTIATIALTSVQTSELGGTHGYAIWLERISDPTDRVCIMRGHFTFEAPV